MASAAWRWASRSRLSRVRHAPSGPWVRLTMIRWVWGSGFPGPADPVGAPDRHEPRPPDMLRPVSARAGPDLPIQVADRGLHPGLVGIPGRPAGVLVAEGIQDGDVLDRPQHQIPRRHRVRPGSTAELLAGVGVLPGEQPPELLLRAHARLAQRRTAGAQVLARTLTVAGQVLLVVAGDLSHVVVAAAGRQLMQVRGHCGSRLSQQAPISDRDRHGWSTDCNTRAGRPVTSQQPSVAGAAQPKPSSAPINSVTARRTSSW
jgi:hypothetical protein